MSKTFCSRRTLFFLILVTCAYSSYENDFFLAKKPLGHKHVCVTNSSFAISWIIDDLRRIQQKGTNCLVSTFIPEQQKNTFDCEIKSNDATTDKYFMKSSWTLRNSLNNNIADIVLDRRWEDIMPIYTTKYVEKFEFVTVLSTLRDNFEIPLSIRIAAGANIHLCDGDNPSKSNCYWFALQPRKGKASRLHKCERGKIFDLNVTSNHREYLYSEKWTHFILKKEKNHLNFFEIDENYKNSNNAILEYHDKDNPLINVSHMIINSDSVSGFWKVHEIEYLFTKNETEDINFGPPIKVTQGFVCISMFVSMCNSCKLKFTLNTLNNEKIEDKYYQHSEWTEIKFIVDNVKVDQALLFISTSGNSQDRFWAIDKIRLCLKEEFRIISVHIPEEMTCQLMSYDYKNAIISSSGNVTDIENHCPEDTIGEFCVPCKWIYPSCRQVRVCTLKNRKEICSCAAGYINTDQCKKECNAGTYGHGCRKQCGKCSSHCNKIDGTCTKGCAGNYTGPRCDIHMENNVDVKSSNKSVNITAINNNNEINKFEEETYPKPSITPISTNGNAIKEFEEETYTKPSSKSISTKGNAIKKFEEETYTKPSSKSISTKGNGIKEFEEEAYTKPSSKPIGTKEPPEAPYDLKIDWSLENNLNLEWKYPNKSNREIRLFHISVIPENIKNNFVQYNRTLSVTNNNYNPTYYHKVDANELLTSTNYTISITADNGLIGKEVKINDFSPPSIPALETDYTKITISSENIILEILLKSPKDYEMRNIFKVFLIISDKHGNLASFPELRKIGTKLNFSSNKLIDEKTINNSDRRYSFLVPLSPGTQYNITLIITNTFNNKTSFNFYHWQLSTTKNSALDFVFMSLVFSVTLIFVIVYVVFVKIDVSDILRKLYKRNRAREYELSPMNMKYDKVTYSKVIHRNEFENYVKESLKNGEFQKQYNAVLQTKNSSVYEIVPDESSFEYIDLEYIDDVIKSRAYRVMEVPRSDNYNDIKRFWNIIWEENIEYMLLIDLSRKKKTLKYWPEGNEKLECGNISIECFCERESNHYKHREFHIIYENERFLVNQFCLKLRHPHGTPEYSPSLVPFFKKFHKVSSNSVCPILVHCSLGIEATGFALLCDMSLRMLKRNNAVDIFKHLQKIGDCNRKMIKNFDYYKLVHLVVLEYICGTKSIDPYLKAYVNLNS